MQGIETMDKFKEVGVDEPRRVGQFMIHATLHNE
jgi:hypothetical protein